MIKFSPTSFRAKQPVPQKNCKNSTHYSKQRNVQTNKSRTEGSRDEFISKTCGIVIRLRNSFHIPKPNWTEETSFVNHAELNKKTIRCTLKHFYLSFVILQHAKMEGQCHWSKPGENPFSND